jgi:uncharacterized protein with von Willebrand factor type A (vWA) domain
MQHPRESEEMIVTPASVEKRLLDLSKEIDEVQQFLDEAEAEYFTAKSDCEISLAKERLELTKSGLKFTVQEKEDIALTTCEGQFRRLGIAEAKVRAARGNAQRVRTQIDITRSIGTSVRASLDN